MSSTRERKRYSLDLKMEAVRLFFEERKSRAEIRQALGVRSEDQVKVWVRQYRREGERAFTKRAGHPAKRKDEKARLQQLEMENALLKKYHTELRKSLLAKRNIGSSTTTGRNTR